MDDKPLSSEELLRRAREGLSSTPPPPEPSERARQDEAARSTESSSEELLDAFASEYETEPDVARERGDFESVAIEPDETFADDVYHAPADERVADDPTPVWQAPMEPSGSPDPFGTPAPRPRRHDGSLPPTAPPAPSVPQRKERSGWGVGRVIWIIVFGVFVLGRCGSALDFDISNPFGGDTHVSELTTGDCVPPLSEDGVIEAVDTVDCSEPHGLEVYAVESLGFASDDYPGDLAVSELAFDACLNRFEPYVGTDYAVSELWIYTLTPIEEGWNVFGDREVVCMLYASPDDGFSIAVETGSKRNSGR